METSITVFDDRLSGRTLGRPMPNSWDYKSAAAAAMLHCDRDTEREASDATDLDLYAGDCARARRVSNFRLRAYAVARRQDG